MMLPLSCRHWAKGDSLREEEEWKQVQDQSQGQPPSQPASVLQVPLHNRFEALELEGEVNADVVGGCHGIPHHNIM